ncbi:MAG: hypothetical protein EGP82_09115 [Odoribacter splanchnicus]|nr:hypothetical protein [Odoribacter splanchnicus]
MKPVFAQVPAFLQEKTERAEKQKTGLIFNIPGINYTGNIFILFSYFSENDFYGYDSENKILSLPP